MKRPFTVPEKLLFLSPLAFGVVAWLFVADPGGDRLIGALPLLGPARENARRSSCQANLKRIGLGFMQYTRDYDEKFPPVASTPGGWGGYGWAEALQPYVKSREIFVCPSQRTPRSDNPKLAGYTHYFYNSRFARLSAGENQNPAVTVLGFEGVPANARAAAAQFPKSWVSNARSPLYRHLGGSNLLFADGHVKWLSGDLIRDFDSRKTYRFSPQAPNTFDSSKPHNDIQGATFTPQPILVR